MKYLYYLLLFTLPFQGCQKEKLSDAGFTVTADETTVAAGQEITFSFSGNPQLISFYPGTTFNNYDSIQGRTLNNALMSFSTTVSSGTQPDQLTVLASSDFNGKYDSANIKAAKWTDITGRFTLATTATATPSSTQNLYDLVVPGKPLYICFRYITKPQAENGGQRNWNVSGFTVLSTVEDTTALLADYASGASFGLYSFGEKQPGRSAISSAALLFKGNSTTAEALAKYTEDWAVSKPIWINPHTLSPDRALPVKGIANAIVDEYKYTYTKPGVYNATFVAAANDIYGSENIVKKIVITVTP